jgi:hypothetical protein
MDDQINQLLTEAEAGPVRPLSSPPREALPSRIFTLMTRQPSSGQKAQRGQLAVV